MKYNDTKSFADLKIAGTAIEEMGGLEVIVVHFLFRINPPRFISLFVCVSIFIPHLNDQLSICEIILQLFINLESIAFSLQPDEIGCKKDSSSASCTNHTKEDPLGRTTLMLGCHKTRFVGSA